MKSFLVVSLLTLLIASTSFSQTLEEYKRKYTNAKELYKAGNYGLAMEGFKQVASQRPQNPYYQYASYFYILSAAMENRMSEALMMIAQMEDKYPSWKQIDEVKLVAADIHFKQRNFKEAFNYLNKIRNGIPEKEIRGVAVTHLDKIKSLDSLKQMNKLYPASPYVAEVLAERLMTTSTSAEDEDFYKKLVKDFKLESKGFSPAFKFETRKKSSYNVALLFPFLLNELNPESTTRPNFYAIDMYEGMKLGVGNLAKQNIKLNLFTYDVGKDNQNLASILSKAELKGMDLIVGPLTNTPTPPVNDFLSANGIFGVNPVATNQAVNETTPALYITEPTLETQGRNTAEYVFQNYSPKSSAIFFGGTPKDSIIALNYHNYLLSQGVKIIAYNKVTRGNVSLLNRVLSDSLNYELGNIFMSTTDQTVAANFVSEVEKNAYKCSIIASPQWLQFSFFNLDQFKRLNYIFIYPDFIDNSLPVIQEFRKTYRASVNLIPSEFSLIGYDVIHYFGRALAQYGTNFQRNLLNQPFTPGELLSGYDFRQGSSNNFVPLVKFVDGDLKTINIPVK